MFKLFHTLFAVLSVLCVTGWDLYLYHYSNCLLQKFLRKKCFCSLFIECCQPLWYNECTTNSDCCSEFCFKGDDNNWEKGVCKPSNSEPVVVKSSSENCHQLWFNHCTGDSDCCSGFCFMGDDKNWKEGICKPAPKTNEGKSIRK